MFLASHIWHFQNKQKYYNKDCYQMHLPITKYFFILYTMSCILKVPKIYKWGSMYSVGSSCLAFSVAGSLIHVSLNLHVYYIWNPVDFDKQKFFITFIGTRFFFNTRWERNNAQQSYNFFYRCSDNSQTCLWPRWSILLTAIFFNHFKHTCTFFLIPCLQWHYVICFKIILYWCLFHFAGSIFLTWFHFLFVCLFWYNEDTCRNVNENDCLLWCNSSIYSLFRHFC